MKKRFLTLYNYNIPYSYRPLSYVRHGYCIAMVTLGLYMTGSKDHCCMEELFVAEEVTYSTVDGLGRPSEASIRGQEGPPMTTKIAIIWFGRTDSGGSSLA